MAKHARPKAGKLETYPLFLKPENRLALGALFANAVYKTGALQTLVIARRQNDESEYKREKDGSNRPPSSQYNVVERDVKAFLFDDTLTLSQTMRWLENNCDKTKVDLDTGLEMAWLELSNSQPPDLDEDDLDDVQAEGEEAERYTAQSVRKQCRHLLRLAQNLATSGRISPQTVAGASRIYLDQLKDVLTKAREEPGFFGENNINTLIAILPIRAPADPILNAVFTIVEHKPGMIEPVLNKFAELLDPSTFLLPETASEIITAIAGHFIKYPFVTETIKAESVNDTANAAGEVNAKQDKGLVLAPQVFKVFDDLSKGMGKIQSPEVIATAAFIVEHVKQQEEQPDQYLCERGRAGQRIVQSLASPPANSGPAV